MSTKPPEFGSPEYHKQVAEGTHPPALFATAPEIIKSHFLGDMTLSYRRKDAFGNLRRDQFGQVIQAKYGHPNALLKYKLGHQPLLTEDIKNFGFDWAPQGDFDRSQITTSLDYLGHGPTVLGGHHRLAAMNAHRPDEFIPLGTYKNISDAFSGGES